MQTAIAIIGGLILGVIILNIYARIRMKTLPKVADHDNILTLTDQNFQQQTKIKVV